MAFTLRLSDTTDEALGRFCDTTGDTKSRVVQRAVEQYLDSVSAEPTVVKAEVGRPGVREPLQVGSVTFAPVVVPLARSAPARAKPEAESCLFPRPFVPAEKCKLPAGHGGEHEFSFAGRD